MYAIVDSETLSIRRYRDARSAESAARTLARQQPTTEIRVGQETAPGHWAVATRIKHNPETSQFEIARFDPTARRYRRSIELA